MKTRCSCCRVPVSWPAPGGGQSRHRTAAAHSARGGMARRKEPGPRLGSARDDEPESFPPLFLWGRTLLPVSLVLLPGLAGLFLCGPSGHTRRCRQPTDETPGRRGCRARLPTNTSEDRKPGNAATAFRRPGWKAVAAVRVLAARRLSRFSSRGFRRPYANRRQYPDNLRRLYFACWNGFRP